MMRLCRQVHMAEKHFIQLESDCWADTVVLPANTSERATQFTYATTTCIVVQLAKFLGGYPQIYYVYCLLGT